MRMADATNNLLLSVGWLGLCCLCSNFFEKLKDRAQFKGETQRDISGIRLESAGKVVSIIPLNSEQRCRNKYSRAVPVQHISLVPFVNSVLKNKEFEFEYIANCNF